MPFLFASRTAKVFLIAVGLGPSSPSPSGVLPFLFLVEAATIPKTREAMVTKRKPRKISL